MDAAIRAENPSLNLDSVAEQYQQNCKESYNEDMTIEAAKNEVAAQYVESNLPNSPLAMQLIMSHNSGLIREIAAKWNYRLAYRQADEAGRRSLRLQKDFAEGLRQRQRPTAEQIERTAWKVNNGIPIQNANVHYSRMLNQGTFSDAVDDVMVMSNEQAVAEAEEGNFVRVMDHTPDVILQNVADAEDLEVIISFHSLYLAARKDGVLPGHYHNLGNITKSLPQILSDPDAIVRINNGRLNLFTRMPTEKGSNGILSVELNTVKDINDAYNKYNLVISMFSAGDRYARNVITKNAVEVEYKKENLSQVNPQLYEWLAIVNEKSSNDPTIPQGTADVNTQYTQDSEKYSRTGESFASLMEQMEEKIKQYGGMELPGREIEVPKSVAEGTFVSRAASTLLNDPKIKGNEEAKGIGIRGIVEGDYNRKRMNLDEALRKSKESIQKLGYENVVEEMRDRITDGSVLNEREMARYVTLRNAAIDAGDWDVVQDCDTLISTSLSSSGRNLRFALKLLEGLDGEHLVKKHKRDFENNNEKAAERARKERGNVPQETIDRMRGKKAEMET